jgi:hypothetical protein
MPPFCPMEWLLVLLVCLFGCLPLAAKPIEELGNGKYIFASQPPKTDRHPDIQLAGAEVFAFEKNDRQVLGEVFIANSSEASCFIGSVTKNFIQGRVIFLDQGRGLRQAIQFTRDLSNFYPIDSRLLPYARSSVERCRPVVANLP